MGKIKGTHALTPEHRWLRVLTVLSVVYIVCAIFVFVALS